MKDKIPCVGDIIGISIHGRTEYDTAIVWLEESSRWNAKLRLREYQIGGDRGPQIAGSDIIYKKDSWFLAHDIPGKESIKLDVKILGSPYGDILRAWQKCGECSKDSQECFECRLKDHRQPASGLSHMPVAPRIYEKIYPTDDIDQDCSLMSVQIWGVGEILDDYLKKHDMPGYLAWMGKVLYDYLEIVFWHPDCCDHTYVTCDPSEIKKYMLGRRPIC